uniref:Congested-like trachea protein n=1 Tax=Rhabditophanes sp. KR3021 TaxID=114890 RepID=A0AC35U1P6_9BILA
MSKEDFLRSFIAGGVGGSCAVSVGHPFDTVKVRLQTMPKVLGHEKPQFTGVFDCFKKTCLKEGYLSLYKGMAVPVIGAAPTFAVFFGCCQVGKWLQTTEEGQTLTFIQNVNAGVLAGIGTAVIIVPGERIKCLLQIQNTNSNAMRCNGPWDAFKKLYKQKSLYRGTVATLMRAYMGTYELLKRKFSGDQSKEMSPLATLAAGGFAGMANWAVCIPADVIKSRLQIAAEGKYPNGIRDVFREIIREEGARGLFKGFTAVMIRAFPANAACFFGYELTMNRLSGLW